MPDIFTAPEKNNPTPNPVVEDVVTPAKQTPPVRLSSSLPISAKGSTPGLFTSYRTHPLGIKFINQEEGETILLFLRRHFITNVPWIIFTVLFLLAPPVIISLLHVTEISFFALTPQLLFVLLAFYYIVVLNYALVRFIIWFYHVGVVTEQRLLDLDVDNILSYHLAETDIADIVDVSYSQKGFFQSFFNFGDVPIQTEAIKANFEFEQTPRPAEVADIVTDLRPELKGKKHDS